MSLASGDSTVRGRELRGGFDEDCDVVVVGSGAGGAVVATLLAEAGRRVILVEEGPHYEPAQYQRFTPSDAVRKLFRESGMVTAFGLGETPLISLTLGRAVGGSSLLTGGVCFRIPGEVHASWVRELGLDELGERAFEAAYAEVERRIDVREVPESARSESTRRFVEGARSMGIEMRSIARNTGDDCEGNARCNFTCPAGAKRSVDIAFLPSALRHGARIVSDALVERVLVRGGRAVGVEGRLLGGPQGKASHRFRVRAPVVVVACGTLHTPLLLSASGLPDPSELLGRGITLHPAARVVARFDDPVRGWDGALQSVYSDHFAHDGIKLVGVYTMVNVLAASLPGIGAALRRNAEALERTAVFGAMIHDDGGGRVLRSPGREPLITYRMSPRDRGRLWRSIGILGEMAFAAGAKDVIAPSFGLPPLRSVAEARALAEGRGDVRRLECLAFHPLGSARMSNDPRRGLVDQRGEAFGVRGLFVADGSVLPTSIGVNSQVPIMSMAARIAWGIDERYAKLARGAG